MARNRDFGAFEVYDEIGRGAMAVVYRGYHKALNCPIVLKIPHPVYADDETFVARFMREARTVARLRHENIVQVIDCGVHDGEPYIAMELVDGLNLDKWRTTYGLPPLEIALLMFAEICRGIDYAHRHHVIHRDIKPANVMFTREGTIKIMDFGLARGGEDTTALTREGSLLGTPAYMSPEQAKGERVDERSDIFSTGVLAYELLGGTRPFRGNSDWSVINAILTVHHQPLGEMNADVPQDAARIIDKMLEKSPARRPDSMSQILEDLDEVLERMEIRRGKEILRMFAADPLKVEKILAKARGKGGTARAGRRDQSAGAALRHFAAQKDPSHPGPEAVVSAGQTLTGEDRGESGGHAAAPASAAPEDTIAIGPVESAKAVAGQPAGDPAKLPARARANDQRARRGIPAYLTKTLILAGVVAAAAVVTIGVLRSIQNHPPVAEKTVRPPVVSPAQPSAALVVTDSSTHPVTPAAPQESPVGPVVTPPQARASASLTILTQPEGAQIWMDGTVQSNLSNTTFENLEARMYYVKIEKVGFTTLERNLRLKPGNTREVFTLQPIKGTIIIGSDPPADVYVNDVLKQANVSSARITLEPSQYNIRLEHPHYIAKEWRSVRVTGGRDTLLTHRFPIETAVGALKVTAVGGWGMTYLDDDRDAASSTPCNWKLVRAGGHAVTISCDKFLVEGYTVNGTPKALATGQESVKLMVPVREGEKTTLEFRLKGR